MTRFLKYSLYLVALLLFASCHSTRHVTGDLTGAHPEKARFEAVVSNAYRYEALQSKVKLSLGKSSINGRMCLESGRRFALLANAPLLGFELGRIEATPDSVVLVDKFDKLYCVVTLTELTKVEALAGHEMEAVECLMLGRIFVPGVGQASAKDYSRLAWSTETHADGTQGNSTGVYEGKDYRLTYVIDSKGQLVSTTLAMADGKRATWSYTGYADVEKLKPLPHTEEVKATNGRNKSIDAGITLVNPSFGESNWKAFDATSYRKVTVEEMTDVLKKLLK